MKNRVVVHIAGREYTMLAEEEETYIRETAGYVDGQIKEVLKSGRLSLADSAVLASMNITDQYFKEKTAGEGLRRQIKEALEETARLEKELSECKREIFKLQNRK